MGARFAFDSGGIREAAGQVGGTFDAPTGFTSCEDCGSALVADTVELFADQLEQAVRAARKSASGTGASMAACADDFNQVETTNALTSRNLMQMMSR